MKRSSFRSSLWILSIIFTFVRIVAANPEELVFDVPEGAELYPDPVGFVVVRGPLESIPEYTTDGHYEVPTSVLFQAVNKAGIPDETRTLRVAEGSYYSPFKEEKSSSGSTEIIEFYPNGTGSFSILKSASGGSSGVSPFEGSSSYSGTFFNGIMVDGTSSVSFGLQGNRGDYDYAHWGFPVQGANGDISYSILERYHYNGDWYLGYSPSTTYEFQRLTRASYASIELESPPSTTASLASGQSRSSGTLGVFAGEGGGVPSYWTFDDTAVTSGTLTGIPAGANLLAITESETGEIVVLHEDGGQMKVWSSADGTTSLGTAEDPANCTGWFDDSGACHFYTGNLNVDTECPIHIWRPSAGVWQRTDLCDFTNGETLQRVVLDMTRLAEVRIGLHTRGTTTDTIQVLRFDNGTWTPEIIDISPEGNTFADMRVGSIADDDFAVVYRVEDGTKQTTPPVWRVYLETGQLMTEASHLWSLY